MTNRDEVLRKKEDFNLLYKKGKSVASYHVVLITIKNNLPYNRRAFLASKKVGNSVCRNRARRLMKEAFRQREAELPPGYDMLFIARANIADSKCADVKKSIDAVLRRSGIIQ